MGASGRGTGKQKTMQTTWTTHRGLRPTKAQRFRVHRRFRTISRSPVSRTWSALLSLVPVLTLGIGAAVPFLYWGLWLRSRKLLAVGAAYGVGACLCLAVLNGNGWWQAAFGTLLALALMSVGTAHAFVLRHELLGEVLHVYRGDSNAERLALERIWRRDYARVLLRSEPLLAFELRIGRPDLPREFDDGGLIDVNHASASALTLLPDINEDMASQIVSARESVGGFSSLDDMSVVVGCAPQAFDRLEDFLVFVA